MPESVSTVELVVFLAGLAAGLVVVGVLFARFLASAPADE
jgi:hypothetical protein